VSSSSDLEKRIKRLEDILYSLGEVLKAGTTTGKQEWKAPPAGHFQPGELEKILYTLGDGLTINQPDCPPWCGKTGTQPDTAGDAEEEGGEESQEETK
jgi:hypothetical protein